MQDTTAETILLRLKNSLAAKSDSELGRMLGVSQQAVSNAKSNNKLPDSWVRIAAERYNLCTDWLFFGRGPMRPSDTSMGHPEAVKQPEIVISEPCARCVKLEVKLEKVEEQRDSLMDENRKLWKENGELREKCARLEERQGQSEAAPFGECCSTNLPCSNRLHERP